MFVSKLNGCSEPQRLAKSRVRYWIVLMDVRKKINWMFGMKTKGCSAQKLMDARKVFARKFEIEMSGCSERSSFH